MPCLDRSGELGQRCCNTHQLPHHEHPHAFPARCTSVVALLRTFDLSHSATAFFDLDPCVAGCVYVPDPVNTLAKRSLVRFTTELLARDVLGANATAGYGCHFGIQGNSLRRTTAAFKRAVSRMAKYAARGWSFANPSGGGSRDPGPPLQPAFIPGHGWARVDSGGAACAQYDFASPLLAAYAENAAHYGTAAVPATFDDARAAARTWRANSYFAIRSQHQQTTPEESSEESSESDAGDAGGAGDTGALMDDSE